MPVDPKLLAILVCPKCKGKISETKLAAKTGEPGDGLKCDACKLIYPVKNDIPVMLIDEAQKAS